jgi:hypothetical protein
VNGAQFRMTNGSSLKLMKASRCGW